MNGLTLIKGYLKLNDYRVREIQWAQFNKKIERVVNIILELDDSTSVINNLLIKLGQRLGAKRDIARGIITYLNDKSMDQTIKKIKLKKDLKFIFRNLTSKEKEGFLKYLDPKKKFNCSLDELYTILNKKQNLHGKVLFQSKTGEMLLLDPDYLAECFLMGKLDLKNSNVIGQQPLPLMHISRADSLNSSLLEKTESSNPSPTQSQTHRNVLEFMSFWSDCCSSSSSSDHFVRA